jgi:opacity protein-like surface antigen
MLKKTLLPALIGALCIVSGVALAQSSRIYFAGYMGLNVFGDQAFSDSDTGASGDIEQKNAMSFGSALGLRINNNLRVEAEFDYAKSDMDRIDVSGVGSAELDGNLSNYLGMINVYYDFDVPWKIQPFLGAGLGLGYYDGEVSGGGITESDSAWAVAWQIGGGLKYRVSPDLAITTGYRYLSSTDLEFGSLEMENSSHEFRVGLEWDLPYGAD